MNHKWKYLAAALVINICITGMLIMAALAAGESISKYAFSSGGTHATNGSIIMRSSIGQPMAESVANNEIKLCSGIICPGSGSSSSTTPLPTPTFPATSTPMPTVMPGPTSTPTSTYTPTSTTVPGSTSTPATTADPGSTEAPAETPAPNESSTPAVTPVPETTVPETTVPTATTVAGQQGTATAEPGVTPGSTPGSTPSSGNPGSGSSERIYIPMITN